MTRVKLEITRRSFLKTALAGSGSLALAASATRPGLAAEE